MARWNENVYGGDLDLEIREKLYSTFKTDEFDEKDELSVIENSKIEENLDEAISVCEGYEGDEKNIAFQVLSVVLMKSGAFISDSLSSTIIEHIENDEWSRENEIRSLVMKNLRKLVKEYDPSNPVDIETVNVLKEVEETASENVNSQFKEILSIFDGRIKKLESLKAETSGNLDFDEGYAAMAEEEVEFLSEVRDLIVKHKELGELYEKIYKGYKDSSSSSSSNEAVTASNLGGTEESIGYEDSSEPSQPLKVNGLSSSGGFREDSAG